MASLRCRQQVSMIARQISRRPIISLFGLSNTVGCLAELYAYTASRAHMFQSVCPSSCMNVVTQSFPRPMVTLHQPNQLRSVWYWVDLVCLEQLHKLIDDFVISGSPSVSSSRNTPKRNTTPAYET
ncbi:unnamed protein product [Phytophthora fragariaefolia]|uniref:Unnamed protein product n=1 Tax=Phytophthora fragariaefolia TaxID=1490495 RepID=A0A9W6YM63_9STRA|nr:unnamed protein product [Phytophthora fragariaefolia]